MYYMAGAKRSDARAAAFEEVYYMKRVIAVVLAVLMALPLAFVGSGVCAAAADYAQYAERNGEIIRKNALYAYMENEPSNRSFYVFDTDLKFASFQGGITEATRYDATNEICEALNYLGRQYPGMSTPIFDRIELPPPRSGQSKIWFSLRKDPSAGEMAIGQATAKEYLTANGVSAAKANFDDAYDLHKEIDTKYSEAAYAALQVKAYEFFLYYARKCTKSVTALPADGLIREEVVIPFSDFFAAFFDEPAFTPLFFEYLNLEDAPEFRNAIMEEIYNELWALCHNSAFWLDNGAQNNSDAKAPTYAAPHYYDRANETYHITYTVAAVKTTVSTASAKKVNLNVKPVRTNCYEDDYGYTITLSTGNSFKSIATMATEFDNRLKMILSEVYREELSTVANEYALFLYLRRHLNYGNLEDDDILGEKVTAPNVHIPYDVWVKKDGSLMENYSYAYTAMMNGNGICDGQTKVAQSLLMYIGIKSRVGVYSDSKAGGHVWNYVYFNGKPYILDVGPHRPYPIFNIGKSFAADNKQTDREYDDYSVLGDEFAFLNDMYGSTGHPCQTTVQDGEYVYYVDFTDNCNVYRVMLSGMAKPVKVSTASGDNSVRDIRKYILQNDGSTHEHVTYQHLLDVWNEKFVKDNTKFAALEPQMKAKKHTNAEAWYYREEAGQYYANLSVENNQIVLKLRYAYNTGNVIDHLPVMEYRTSIPVAARSNSTPYQTSTAITGTNRYSAGALVLNGLVNGTLSAPSGDSITRYTISHNGVRVLDKTGSYSAIGLGTCLDGKFYMSYGGNNRTVLGKSKAFNAVEIRAYTKNKRKNTIQAKNTNAYLAVGSTDYTITSVSATTAGTYTLKIDAYDDNTGRTTSYAFSWNGRIPAKAGAINTMCWYNSEARTLLFVLENGEIRELKIPSNGKLFDNNNLHEYKAGQIDLFSAADWNALAALMSRGYYYTGCAVRLQKNIQFRNGSISSFGSTSYKFADTFSGNGFTVSAGKVSNTGDFAGLFGYVSGGAVISNFTVSNVTVSGRNYCGIVGAADGGSTISKVRITDCVIKGKDYVGAIGYASTATVSNVFVTDRMGISGTTCVGGICGIAGANVTIRKCYNGADISGTTCVGGILGSSPDTVRKISEDTVIRCCYNAGSVTASQSYGAGIAGNSYHTKMFRSESYTKAKVAGRY